MLLPGAAGEQSAASSVSRQKQQSFTEAHDVQCMMRT
jgi:hypothetical protein